MTYKYVLEFIDVEKLPRYMIQYLLRLSQGEESKGNDTEEIENLDVMINSQDEDAFISIDSYSKICNAMNLPSFSSGVQ